MKKAQYQNLQFDDREAFNGWLDETTHCTVEFQDMGQDLIKIWVAQSGEILHANLQASIWNGRFVNMESLTDFAPIYLQKKDDWIRMEGLIAEKITYNETPASQLS